MNASNLTTFLATNSSNSSHGHIEDHNASTALFSDLEIQIRTTLVSIIGFFGSIANGLMIYGVADDNRFSEIPANILLLSQGVADLGMTFIVCILYTVNLHINIFKIVLAFGKIFAASSVLSLVALTVDRLASIVWSYKYIRVMSTKKAKVVVILIWCFCAGIRIFDFTDYTQLQRIPRYVNVLGILVLTVCNIVIYLQNMCKKGVRQRRTNKASSLLHSYETTLSI